MLLVWQKCVLNGCHVSLLRNKDRFGKWQLSYRTWRNSEENSNSRRIQGWPVRIITIDETWFRFYEPWKKYQDILEWRKPVCYSIFLELKKQNNLLMIGNLYTLYTCFPVYPRKLSGSPNYLLKELFSQHIVVDRDNL